jgi:hypothetical protein
MKYDQEEFRAQLVQWGHMSADDDIEVGIASYQDFFHEELDDISKFRNGRALRVDGEAGPATTELLSEPRCGCPDRPLGMDREEANWPPDCRLDLTVFYQTTGLNLSAGDVDEAFQAGLQSWEEVIDVGFRKVESRSAAKIWSTNKPLGGSTLAWSYLARNTCNARLEQRYNTRTRWNSQYLQGVVAHEYGHALGSGHLRDPAALMYPYARQQIYKPSKVDVRWMKRLGYNDPLAPPPDPEPEKRIKNLAVDGDEVLIEYEDGGEDSFKWM